MIFRKKEGPFIHYSSKMGQSYTFFFAKKWVYGTLERTSVLCHVLHMVVPAYEYLKSFVVETPFKDSKHLKSKEIGWDKLGIFVKVLTHLTSPRRFFVGKR